MKSSAYWRERYRLIEEAQHKNAVEVLRDLEREFSLAQRSIENQIHVWYGRFADNNQISLSDARRWLDEKTLAELKWDVKEYIKHGQENALEQQWAKQLENASARYHISRLEALQLQTQNTMERLFGNQLEAVDGLMKQTYLDSYYRSMFEVQRGVGVGWDVAGLNERQIQKVLSKPWTVDGATFSDRIWSQKEKLVHEIHTQLMQNMILGRSPDESIKAIAQKFDTSRANAGRLVMTESAYFTSLAEKDAFKELGVEEFQVIETLDSRTCELCGEMDGKTGRVSRFAVGVTAPPFHPRCRGTTAPYFSDETGERIARDEEGKHYYVPGDMTYQEWKEKYVGGGGANDDGSTGEAGSGIIDIEKTKQVLHKAEMSIKDLNHEEGYIIGRDGSIIHHEKGKAHSVAPPEHLIKDNIFTHNHPSGGCALSLDDVKSTIALDGYEIRAVTSDGRFVSLSRGSSTWNTSIADDMSKEGLGGWKLVAEATRRAQLLHKGKITEAQMLSEAEKMVNDWLRNNAQKYGHIYREGMI